MKRSVPSLSLTGGEYPGDVFAGQAAFCDCPAGAFTSNAEDAPGAISGLSWNKNGVEVIASLSTFSTGLVDQYIEVI